MVDTKTMKVSESALTQNLEGPQSMYMYNRGVPLPRLPLPGTSCPDALKTAFSRLLPFRFSTVWLQFVCAAPGAPFILAAGAPVARFFIAGIGDPGAGNGIPRNLTRQDTDALQQGVVVDDGQMFVIEGMSFEMGLLNMWNAGALSEDTPNYLFTGNEDSYVRLIERKALEVCSLVLRRGTAAGSCEARLGRLDQWPTTGQSGIVNPSAQGIAGRFNFAAYPEITLGLQSTQRISIDLNVETIGSVLSVAGNPTAASTINLPVRCKLWGYPECMPESLMAMLGGKAGKLAAKLAELPDEKLDRLLTALGGD